LLDADPTHKNVVVRSDVENVGTYVSVVGQFAQKFKSTGKSIVFLGKDFLYALLGDPTSVDPKQLEVEIAKDPSEMKDKKKKERGFEREIKAEAKQGAKKVAKLLQSASMGKGKDAVTGIAELRVINLPSNHKMLEYFVSLGFSSDE